MPLAADTWEASNVGWPGDAGAFGDAMRTAMMQVRSTQAQNLASRRAASLAEAFNRMQQHDAWKLGRSLHHRHRRRRPRSQGLIVQPTYPLLLRLNAGELDASEIAALLDAGFDAGLFGINLKKITRGIGRTVSGAARSVGRTVGSVAKAVDRAYVSATPQWLRKGLGTVARLSPYGLTAIAAQKIASGQRIDRALVGTAREGLSAVQDVLPIAQTIVQVIPGIGQGVSAALGAASGVLSLAQGKPIDEAFMQVVKGAMPGGPFAATALEAAFKTTMALAHGKRLDTALLNAARDAALSRIPGGEVARKAAAAAFDMGIALAEGKRLQDAAVKAGMGLAGSIVKVPAGVNRFLQSQGGRALQGVAGDVLSGKRVDQSLLNAGSRYAQNFVRLPSGLSVPRGIANDVLSGKRIDRIAMEALANDPRVSQLSNALLRNPALRSVPIAELANRANVPIATAQNAVASVVSAARQVGNAPGFPRLFDASGIAPQLPMGMTMDQALARFASRAAPTAFSPSPIRWRAISRHGFESLARHVPAMRHVHPQRQWMMTLQHLARDARGLDGSGTKYIVEPGDSPSRIAKRITGKDTRYPELLAANPQVKRPGSPGFLIRPGDVLNLPPSWIGTVQPTGAPASPAAYVPASTAAPVATTGLTFPMYTVKPNDSPSSIARKYTGNDRRYPELIATNPQIRRAQPPGFLIVPGQQLRIPDAWRSGALTTTAPTSPPAQPTQPMTYSAPSNVPADATDSEYDPKIAQVQLMLAAWTAKEDNAPSPRFGTSPGDLAGYWTAGTRNALKRFQLWWNANRGGNLRAVGILDDATYQALTTWAKTTAVSTVLNPQSTPSYLPPALPPPSPYQPASTSPVSTPSAPQGPAPTPDSGPPTGPTPTAKPPGLGGGGAGIALMGLLAVGALAMGSSK